MDEMATLETTGGKAVLRFKRRLAHPPEKVFRALSEPGELAHWFPARVRWELRPGAPIEFSFEDAGMEAPRGELIEVDPPRLLVYSWGDDVLRWEVVPEGDGSTLRFTHTIAGERDWPARLTAARNAAGWDVCLAALEARLSGEPAKDGDWLARNAAYVERFGLGAGERLDGGRVVRFQRDLVQPPSRVWELLTGGDLTCAAFPAGAETEREPERLLQYEWLRDGVVAGRVRVELRELRWGTGLVVEQTLPPELAARALDEWRPRLDELVAELHGAR